MDVIKKIKLFIGIFIPFFAIFLMSQNTFALYTSDYGARYYEWQSNQCSNEIYDENHFFNSIFYGCQISTIVPITSETTATGDSLVYSGKLNLVKRLNPQRNNGFYSNIQIGVRSIYFGNYLLNLSQTPSLQYWITDWTNNNNYYQTLTIQWSIVATNSNIVNTNGKIRVSFFSNNNNGRFDAPAALNNSGPYYFENTHEDPVAYFIDTGGQANNTIINQNNISISQNEQMINQNQTYYNKEYQSEQNISGQNSGDIEGAENQQTTTLLNVLSGFLGAITNIQPQSACRFNVDFPQFAGGRQVADICLKRDNYAVNVFSSVVAITVFIPLAWILIKMIYNEIRSWTNG